MKFSFTLQLLKKKLKHEKFIVAGADHFSRDRVKELTAAISLLENADKIIIPQQTKIF